MFFGVERLLDLLYFSTQFAAIVFAAVLAIAAAGIAPAHVAYSSPLLLADAPGVYPSYAVAPLGLPHPIHSAAPSGLVLKPALLAAAPVVKTVAYAAPVLKAVSEVHFFIKFPIILHSCEKVWKFKSY